MRTLSAIMLLALLATSLSASGLDRKPRTAARNEPKITAQTVAAPADRGPVERGSAEISPDAPTVAGRTSEAVQPRLQNDMDLGLTAAQADSLVALWRERQSAAAFQEYFDNFILEDSATAADGSIPDSVYINRLRALVSPVPLPYNSIVRNYINRYTNTQYGIISRILGLSQYYFPMIEEMLIKEGLPVELRAVPIIESALLPTATSRQGAAGLWQFMPATGKHYGLEINSLVDERRDPIRATQAACRFLKDLYKIYGDWTLVIAAYNCGHGNVNKAIARSGGKTFWEIYDYLPAETRGYVPAFIGATYAYAYHRNHGIQSLGSPIPLSVDTIHVNRLMHFEQISSTIDVPIETLRQLNPQYRLDIIPATTKNYTLVLPQRSVTQYIACQDEICAKDSIYLKEYLNPANLDKKRQMVAGSTYTVKSGDTLGAIAKRNGVSVKQLQNWNNIKDPRSLRIGQKIRIEGR